MSALFNPDPRRFLPDVVRRLAGTPQAAQPTLEEWLSGMPRSAQLEITGAPEVDIEQARQQERLLGPTGVRTIVEARGLQGDPIVGQEEPAPRRGLLEILGDYGTRLQSATTGFATGLAGMERLRQTRDASGVADGTLFDRPEQVEGGWELARERFRQGLRGEEKFQAADFGVLAYDRSEAGAGERFMKSATGFVLDVAMDPLTYVSFGASILGRRMGAVAVNAQASKNASRLTGQLSPEAQLDVVRDAVRRAGTEESIVSARLRELYPDLNIGLGEAVPLEDVLARLAGSPDRIQAAANDAIAAASAAMYRSFGAGGLRKYLVNNYGEAGREFWRTLPADLRGGVRIRVPFSGFFRRTETGAPMPLAIPLVPWETGVVADKTNFAGLSNGVRELLRSNMLLRGGSTRMSGLTGATDAATASKIYRLEAETGNRLFGRKLREIDPTLTATSWESAQATNELMLAFRRGAMSSQQKLVGPVSIARAAYRSGRDKFGDEFDSTFDNLLKRNLADIDGNEVGTIDEALNLAGRAATDAEVEAYTAAFQFQKALRLVEFELQDLEVRSPGFTANMLENYWPRVLDDMERELSGKGYGASFGNLKNRTHFVAEYNPDGTVKRWMTPGEITQQIGRAKFIEDADLAMSAYLVSMNKLIQEERLFHHLMERGVIFRGGANAIETTPDLSAAAGRWAAVSSQAELRRAALETAGFGADAPALSGAVAAGRPLDEVVGRAEELARTLQLGRTYGYRMTETYRPVTIGGRAAFRSPDGVTITRTDAGTFAVTRQIGDDIEWLTPDLSRPRWTKTQPQGAFATLDEATGAANRNMATVRKRQFVEQMQTMRDEFFENYAALTRGYRDLEHLNLNPLNPANVPLEHQDAYFDILTDVLNQFGDAAGLVNRQVRADAYRNADWGMGRGQAYAPVSTSDGPQIRQYWADRMQRLGIFAPETVIGDIKNIYRVQQRPEGFAKFVDEFYRPFYAWQKALMTSQRGPGYVLRNIQGGMWNAYLIGTSARHFRTAGAVKVAEAQARHRAKRAFPDERQIRERAERAQEEFQKILRDKFGDKRGAELSELWLMFERRGLRGREISSRTPGTQAVAQASGELSGDLSRTILDADQNAVQRAAEWGTSHWWARTMGDMAQGSEDYLRFSAFLRGVELYGFEDGGRAAGLIVRASQFDYADLSPFEAEFVKMLIPFYTWTRNNVPLQFRAMISEPGKIMRAIRLNDALADAFGDPDDPEEPLPAYVRERFGWRVREDVMVGPDQDAISAGMVFGEPLVDINRLFGTPTRPGGWGLSTLNWREVANNINPTFRALAPTVTAMELSTGGTLPREEEAPAWAQALRLGRVTPDGERVMNARALRVARDIVVPLGMAERYAPQLLGNERMQRRWYTSMGSAILGLPVSTLDPFQTTAEMRTQERRLRSQLTREMGDNYPERLAYVRAALELGATPQEFQFIRETLLDGRDVKDVPLEELDVWRMRDTINFLRRVEQLRQRGVPDESIRLMAEYFTPRTDMEMGVRAGGVQPLTAEQLAEVGETPESVARMNEQQLGDVVARYAARNPGWAERRR